MGKNKSHFEELSNRVIGAAIEINKEFEPGFLEGIYEKVLKILLAEKSITFEKQKNKYYFSWHLNRCSSA